MSFWKGRRVLITGGAGFLGSNLAKRLVHGGARVRIADNLERGNLDNLLDIKNDVEFMVKDLRNLDAACEASRQIEVIFHFAAKVGGIQYYQRYPDEIYRDNVSIDQSVLEGSLSTGVERYFYASTAHVYPIEKQIGNHHALREEEAFEGFPPVSYGLAKRFGEQRLQTAVSENRTLHAACFRLIGIYGPHQDIDLDRGSVIPVLIRRAIEYPKRKPFLIKSAGDEIRTFCYVTDALKAILRSVEELDGQRSLGPFNVGSEQPVRIKELADDIIRLSGKKIDCVEHSQNGSPIKAQILDCSKVRQQLGGWKPETTLKEGLRMTFADIASRLDLPSQKNRSGLAWAGLSYDGESR